ncbi:zinc-finger domain-containing protein [Kangiella marina]|uniref:Zinc-finger domain-containing protein n=1 Tax=Kangiella marina TaxID=1079178 RepID=A0ABP8IFV3_9GAMM
MSHSSNKTQAEPAKQNVNKQQPIHITADDLPLSCPTPGMTLWSQHPRVFIPIEDGEGHCPYCGNTFLLKS